MLVCPGDSDASTNNELDDEGPKKDLSDDDSDNESNSQSPGAVDGKASAMANGAPFIVSCPLVKLSGVNVSGA